MHTTFELWLAIYLACVIGASALAPNSKQRAVIILYFGYHCLARAHLAAIAG